MKKYSEQEKKVVVKSQLYSLDQQFKHDSEQLLNVSDLLPGVILINDMAEMKNTYMNAVGLNFLQRTQEELTGMGVNYFGEDIFCKDEMKWIVKHFDALVQRDDAKEVSGFFQKVRPNKQTPWSYFYLTGKMMEQQPGKFIYMSIRTDKDSYTRNQISRTLDLESPDPVAFQRFSSLTKREKEILGLLSRGFTNAYISDYLFLAQFTVETHRKNINKKLGTKNLADLVRIADKFQV